ncbi:uncharacterized protein L201_002345 [Kwoniella dendrophila CBS 6074]|uniref:F-box domain-containing protein n=1 Tax=Kwoniella dendrophila CBS 6074 TaxID=1295534 RepID=A0AAX4JQW5_9TREE
MPIAIPTTSTLNDALSIKTTKKGYSLPSSSKIQSNPLPIDVIRRISQHLVNDEYLNTVSNIQRCSKELYFAITPILYKTLHIQQFKSDSLLSFPLGLEQYSRIEGKGGLKGVNIKDNEDNQDDQNDDDLFKEENTLIRRLKSFEYVQNLIIHSLPSDEISENFNKYIKDLSFIIFPNLNSSVELLPQALDDLRTWVPPTYTYYHNQSDLQLQLPAFLKMLIKNSKPEKLCIAFKSLLSENWEKHRDLTLQGQYQLIKRLSNLHLSSTSHQSLWGKSLKFVNIHNIVHQILPIFQNCENNYFFQSHLIGTSANPILVKPGTKKSVYLPGPEYSYRSWQIIKSIQQLFPSNVKNPLQVIENTKWNFINSNGHIATKSSDDDDDDGYCSVNHKQVSRLIKDSVKFDLPQDLPMRQGFDRSMINRLFDQIHYLDDEEVECKSCHGMSI